MRNQACSALNALMRLSSNPKEFIISTKIEMSQSDFKDMRKKDQVSRK